MHPFVNTAIKAAREAATIITRAYARPDLIRMAEKGPRDFVTSTDKAAEEVIIYTLRSAYPNHAILAEESGSTTYKSDDHQWIIDPIDGTKNFMHGFPHFCVSIALKYKDQIEHGVIYDPLRDDLFIASRGEGAQKNNRRMRVTQPVRLKDCLLATGLPFHLLEQYGDRYYRALQALTQHCSGVRQSGSAALDLAYLAAGQIDALFELKLQKWDMAAGILMIKEAGGMITDLTNEGNHFKNGQVIAANPKIIGQLLKIIQPIFINHENQ